MEAGRLVVCSRAGEAGAPGEMGPGIALRRQGPAPEHWRPSQPMSDEESSAPARGRYFRPRVEARWR